MGAAAGTGLGAAAGDMAETTDLPADELMGARPIGGAAPPSPGSPGKAVVEFGSMKGAPRATARPPRRYLDTARRGWPLHCGVASLRRSVQGPWCLPHDGQVVPCPTALCVRTALSMGGSGLGMLLGIRILVVLLPVYAIVRLTSTAVNKPVS